MPSARRPRSSGFATTCAWPTIRRSMRLPPAGVRSWRSTFSTRFRKGCARSGVRSAGCCITVLSALAKRLRKLGASLLIKRARPRCVAASRCADRRCRGLLEPPAFRSGNCHRPGAQDTVAETGIIAKSFNGNLLHEPSLLKTGDGGPYRVYSPFWRAFERQGEPRRPLPAPQRLNAFEGMIDSIAPRGSEPASYEARLGRRVARDLAGR